MPRTCKSTEDNVGRRWEPPGNGSAVGLGWGAAEPDGCGSYLLTFCLLSGKLPRRAKADATWEPRQAAGPPAGGHAPRSPDSGSGAAVLGAPDVLRRPR